MCMDMCMCVYAGGWEERYSPRAYPTAKQLGAPDRNLRTSDLSGSELGAAQSVFTSSLQWPRGVSKLGSPRVSKLGSPVDGTGSSATDGGAHVHAGGEGVNGGVGGGGNGTFEIREVQGPGQGAGYSSLHQPGFLLNFTVEADCTPILPYGVKNFPPAHEVGTHRNYRSLPFPLRDSHCKATRAHTMHAFAHVHALDALAEGCIVCAAGKATRASGILLTTSHFLLTTYYLLLTTYYR